MTMSLKPKTMDIESDLRLPKLPEIISTVSETELFINSRFLKIKEKNIPTLIEEILPEVNILGLPEEKLIKAHSTIHLKVSDKFVSVKGSDVILAAEPLELTLVPVPGNSRIVSLYLPNRGYIVVEPLTKKLVISPKEPTYFFIDRVEQGMVLKSLVPTDLKEIKTDEEMETLLPPVLELVSLLQEQGIVDDIVQRALRWRDVSRILII